MLAVPCLEDLNGKHQEAAERNLSGVCLDLDTLLAMEKVHVLDLVPQHRRQLVLARHQGEQTLSHEDVSSRKSKCIHHVTLWHIVELVRKLPAGSQPNDGRGFSGSANQARSNLIDVSLNRLVCPRAPIALQLSAVPSGRLDAHPGHSRLRAT